MQRYNMASPDWAKRDWKEEDLERQNVQQEDGSSYAAQNVGEAALPSAGRREHRGSVARKLLIFDVSGLFAR